MKNVLHGLFNGKIIPWERQSPRSAEQLEILKKVEIEERYFIQKMSLDDSSRFEELSALHLQLIAFEEDDIFSYGFTMGMLLMMNVMAEAETICN